MSKAKTVGKIIANIAKVTTVIFIILKLCKVIKWSWLWVLSPYWITIGLCLLFLTYLICDKVVSNKK